MTQEGLINVFKYIVKKCDMLINNGDYEADAYTQDTVEDIAELCNHILDGDYGKLVEVKEVDLIKEVAKWKKDHQVYGMDETFYGIAKHFFELGLAVSNKAQKGEKA